MVQRLVPPAFRALRVLFLRTERRLASSAQAARRIRRLARHHKRSVHCVRKGNTQLSLRNHRVPYCAPRGILVPSPVA